MQKKYSYVGHEVPTIIPTINNISLRNIRKVKTADDVRRIEGDIFYNDICVGYYNPIYKDKTDLLPRKYVRIETKFSELKEFFKDYVSFDCCDGKKYEEEVKGIENLLFDLERLNLIANFVTDLIAKEIKHHYTAEDYDANKEISEFGDVVSLINGDNMKAVIIKDSYKMNNLSTMNLIKENVPSISLNENYRIIMFRKPSDFNITTSKFMLKVPKCMKKH